MCFSSAPILKASHTHRRGSDGIGVPENQFQSREISENVVDPEKRILPREERVPLELEPKERSTRTL